MATLQEEMFCVGDSRMRLRVHGPPWGLSAQLPSGFSATVHGGGQGCPYLLSAHPSVRLLLYTLGFRLLFSRPSCGFSGCLLSYLARNPVWQQEEMRVAPTYSGATLNQRLSFCRVQRKMWAPSNHRQWGHHHIPITGLCSGLIGGVSMPVLLWTSGEQDNNMSWRKVVRTTQMLR